MLHIGFFNVLWAMACVYAVLRGGQPERLATLGWAIGCAATFSLPYDPAVSWHGVEWGELKIDLVVLVWFVAISAFANRFWPIWLAAVHLLSIAVHGVKGYDQTLLPSVYSVAVGKIAYAMLLLLVIGIARHQHRLRSNGVDHDWSFARQAPM
jgi:hypothetical protein